MEDHREGVLVRVAVIPQINKGSITPEENAFRHLYLHTILQLLEEHNDDACVVASDLLQCHKNLRAKASEGEIDASMVSFIMCPVTRSLIRVFF